MVKRTREDTKLLLLPRKLVDKLDDAARRRGLSLASFTRGVLEQSLRASERGISLGEALDMYNLAEVQRSSGALEISRTSFDAVVAQIYSQWGDQLKIIWREAGEWYGEYLKAKLKGGNLLSFFEKALLVSWNLNEAVVEEVNEDEVRIRCTSFMMPTESTELLVGYVSGVMSSLGFDESDRDYLRGMAILSYRRSTEPVKHRSKG